MTALLHDAHNHLQDPLLDDCRIDFLTRRAALGIGVQVVNGTCEADWHAVRALAESHPDIVPAFGIHPWHIDTVSKAWQRNLTGFLDDGGCMGEIGLDCWKTTSNFNRQREIFLWQWNEAIQRGIAATVHCLRAWGALMDIIREAPHHSPGFLLHAYGGPEEMVDEWVNLGAYFSFSASFLAEGRERKLKPFQKIPADRLLVETDAPSMPPPASLLPSTALLAPDGTRINHPGSIQIACKGLAQVRMQPLDAVVNQVNENFLRLFSGQ